MNDNPISSSTISVQMAYDNYLKNKYIVNRKYQRKLVWTLEEKAAFIDSLSKWYSVPLFLFASKEEQGVIQYEIIDGMQRLNAIMSFIENEYPLESNGQKGYFDLNTLASTKSLFDQGLLEQQTPILDRQICVNITNYPLPYSIINADTKSIEAIFRRINSFGKQLSNQEIRQAGAVGIFPNLVRKVSSDIRHDVSPSDLVVLNKMKEISLSNKKLKYGIVMEDTFWVKQKIVTIQNMRVSRDEELVAWILSYMILGDQVEPSSKALNHLYQYDENTDNKLSMQMETAIAHVGEDVIISWFRTIHAEMLKILQLANKNFRTLVYSDAYSEGLVRTYQVIFLVLFELIIKDGMTVYNYTKLIQTLDHIALNHLKGISDSNWKSQTRIQKIQAVKGIILPCFKKRKGEDVAKENWILELDNIIRLSRIEGTQYDFKTGFHDLETGEFNKKLVAKIVEILTAEVNKAPETKGYVIVGITEGEETLKKFQKLYGTTKEMKFEGTDFYITGVQDEIEKYYKGSGDKLQNEILSVIRKSPVDEAVKNEIMTHFRMAKYGEYDIIIFELSSHDKPVLFNDAIYVRNGNQTRQIIGVKATFDIYKNIFNTDYEG